MLYPVKSFSDLKVGDKIWKKGGDLGGSYEVLSLDGGLPGYIYVTDILQEPHRLYMKDKDNGDEDVFANYTYFKYDEHKDILLACARWHQERADSWRASAEQISRMS